MRQATVTIRPTEGYFHPVDRRLVEDPAVTPEAVHHVELLADETVTMLASVTGDGDRYREILDAADAVLEFVVTGDGDRWFGYSRVVPNDLTLALFERRRSTDAVVELPIEYTADGGQRYTIVGTEAAFAGGLDLPDGLDVTVESIGEYRPGGDALFGALTAREREVLDAALERGYYETPREATHADVAEALDCSASTVGDHLRSIESKVLGAYR